MWGGGYIPPGVGKKYVRIKSYFHKKGQLVSPVPGFNTKLARSIWDTWKFRIERRVMLSSCIFPRLASNLMPISLNYASFFQAHPGLFFMSVSKLGGCPAGGKTTVKKGHQKRFWTGLRQDPEGVGGGSALGGAVGSCRGYKTECQKSTPLRKKWVSIGQINYRPDKMAGAGIRNSWYSVRQEPLLLRNLFAGTALVACRQADIHQAKWNKWGSKCFSPAVGSSSHEYKPNAEHKYLGSSDQGGIRMTKLYLDNFLGKIRKNLWKRIMS